MKQYPSDSAQPDIVVSRQKILKILGFLISKYPEIMPYLFNLNLNPYSEITNWEGGSFLDFLISISAEVEPMTFNLLEIPFKSEISIFIRHKNRTLKLSEYICTHILKKIFDEIIVNENIMSHAMLDFLDNVSDFVTPNMFSLESTTKILNISQHHPTISLAKILTKSLSVILSHPPEATPDQKKKRKLPIFSEEDYVRKLGEFKGKELEIYFE